MIFTHAIARRPGKEMANGITTATVGVPDYTKAIDQFNAYVNALTDCGVSVTILDSLDGYPDAHFVEDTAVVTPDVAIITNPGAASRIGEVASIADALESIRKTVWIRPPGTLDGGDVLMVGQHLFIGLSDRTNENGARQLGEAVAQFGYSWTPVPVAAGLHFKSSVNAVGDTTLLTTETFADHPALANYDRIVVSPDEEYAANTLRINQRIIMPAGFPDTCEKLKQLRRHIIQLDTSEFKKMDGGLTCLSLRF